MGTFSSHNWYLERNNKKLEVNFRITLYIWNKCPLSGWEGVDILILIYSLNLDGTIYPESRKGIL